MIAAKTNHARLFVVMVRTVAVDSLKAFYAIVTTTLSFVPDICERDTRGKDRRFICPPDKQGSLLAIFI